MGKILNALRAAAAAASGHSPSSSPSKSKSKKQHSTRPSSTGTGTDTGSHRTSILPNKSSPIPVPLTMDTHIPPPQPSQPQPQLQATTTPALTPAPALRQSQLPSEPSSSSSSSSPASSSAAIIELPPSPASPQLPTSPLSQTHSSLSHSLPSPSHSHSPRIVSMADSAIPNDDSEPASPTMTPGTEFLAQSTQSNNGNGDEHHVEHVKNQPSPAAIAALTNSPSSNGNGNGNGNDGDPASTIMSTGTSATDDSGVSDLRRSASNASAVAAAAASAATASTSTSTLAKVAMARSASSRPLSTESTASSVASPSGAVAADPQDPASTSTSTATLSHNVADKQIQSDLAVPCTDASTATDPPPPQIDAAVATTVYAGTNPPSPEPHHCLPSLRRSRSSAATASSSKRSSKRTSSTYTPTSAPPLAVQHAHTAPLAPASLYFADLPSSSTPSPTSLPRRSARPSTSTNLLDKLRLHTSKLRTDLARERDARKRAERTLACVLRDRDALMVQVVELRTAVAAYEAMAERVGDEVWEGMGVGSRPKRLSELVGVTRCGQREGDVEEEDRTPMAVAAGMRRPSRASPALRQAALTARSGSPRGRSSVGKKSPWGKVRKKLRRVMNLFNDKQSSPPPSSPSTRLLPRRLASSDNLLMHTGSLRAHHSRRLLPPTPPHSLDPAPMGLFGASPVPPRSRSPSPNRPIPRPARSSVNSRGGSGGTACTGGTAGARVVGQTPAAVAAAKHMTPVPLSWDDVEPLNPHYSGHQDVDLGASSTTTATSANKRKSKRMSTASNLSDWLRNFKATYRFSFASGRAPGLTSSGSVEDEQHEQVPRVPTDEPAPISPVDPALKAMTAAAAARALATDPIARPRTAPTPTDSSSARHLSSPAPAASTAFAHYPPPPPSALHLRSVTAPKPWASAHVRTSWTQTSSVTSPETCSFTSLDVALSDTSSAAAAGSPEVVGSGFARMHSASGGVGVAPVPRIRERNVPGGAAMSAWAAAE